VYKIINTTINCLYTQSVYTLELTNDHGVVVTDQDGNGGAFGDNTTTTAAVYIGGQKDSGWTFSASPPSEDGFEWIQEKEKPDTFWIKSMVDDSGQLIITATKEGKSI
jgi:hypothetical protein